MSLSVKSSATITDCLLFSVNLLLWKTRASSESESCHKGALHRAIALLLGDGFHASKIIEEIHTLKEGTICTHTEDRLELINQSHNVKDSDQTKDEHDIDQDFN